MSRLPLSKLASFAILSLLVFTVAMTEPPFDPIGELQPVVFTGDQVVDLQGKPIDEVWAYRYESVSGSFVQVPIQIDERAPYDLTQNIPGGPWDPVYELTYDWLGTDGGLLDADDEIVVMARDAGDRAPDTDVWVPWADDVRVELRVYDPFTEESGFIYLFTSPTLVDVDPSFNYVSYDAPDPFSGIAEVDAPHYSIGFESRWILTRIEIKPNPDLLDRVKARAYQLDGNGETEEHFDGSSVLLGAYGGKVRALREVQGAMSGPGTTHLDSFYRDTWQRTLHLRVHAMPSIWYYYDYSPPSSAGRFFSSEIPTGIVVDGSVDPPSGDTPSEWNQVSLPEGTLVSQAKVLTPFPTPEPGRVCAPDSGSFFYWQDDDAFDDATGDDPYAIGNHGLHIYCTADTSTSPYSHLMKHYFLQPQDPYVSVWPDYAARAEDPLDLTTEAQIRSALTDARLDAMERAGNGRLAFHWTDALGEDVYEIYRGELVSPFNYGHDTALGCELPAQATTWTTEDDQETAQPSYYYLVVPRRGSERAYGNGGWNEPRPPSLFPCP